MRIRFAFLILILPLTAWAAERAPLADRDHEQLTARHYVLEPQHVLSAAERAALVADGVIVQRALPGGRYLVRVARESAFDASDPRVRTLSAVTVADKLQASAYRAAQRGTPFARLHVVFNDDVSIDDALAAIEAAGGSTTEPLVVDFGPLHSLKVRLPSTALRQFASDERVLKVSGALPHKAVSYNAAAAALSHVTDIQMAPYNLTGNGVILSYFELAPADPTHPEFEGRLTVHFQCNGSSDTSCFGLENEQHPTHVAGTMIAKGINPDAKGMAPQATLNEYRGADPQDLWLQQKDSTLLSLGAVGDNNSWGFTVGWSQEGTAGWTWTEDDELLGGYDDSLSAVIDHAAIDNQTLMMYASGNEARNTGPLTAPFPHNHVDANGNPTKDIYCYSANGSGTDCPVPQCSAGATFCEKTTHPVRSPYGSVGWLASEKNVIAVGATDFQPFIANFSSRGPAKDGRVKPELTAKGQSLFSTIPVNTYTRFQGTSMSTPVVTGTMALFTQLWRNITGNATLRPSPVMLKAIAIAGADDLGVAGPDATYGFGFLNGKKSADIMVADNAQGKRIKMDSAAQGAQFDYPVQVTSAGDLRFVLSWFDPETVNLSSDPTQPVLVNDLDLKVVGPDGSTTLPYVLDKNDPCYVSGSTTFTCQPAGRGVNVVDNNEEVEIKAAAPGTYHAIVVGKSVPQSAPQAFVLVSSNADFSQPPPPCLDPTEPNDTTTTAYGPLSLSQTISAAICSDTDNDFFKFTTNAIGAVNVTVTTTDTAVTVTVTAPGVATASKTIAPGTTATVTTNVNTSASTPFLVQVSLNGTRGTSGAYTLHATFPFSAPPHRRPAGH
jgi:hypothetical protein